MLKILVAYDGSDEAKRSLDWVARFGGGEVTATVIGVAPTLAGSERIVDSVDPTVEREELRGQLREAAETLRDAGVVAEAVERAGNPAEMIIETAEAGNYDLVVVGTQGRHAIKRFLFGSTADRVARYAPCPVLLVR
jgi:nucleotide-binding universal stress UspA family protein